MVPRALLLDFGGTLVGSRAAFLPLFQEAGRRTGVRVDWSRFLRANEEVWEDLWPEAPRLLGRTPSFADIVHARALERADATGPIEKMVQCIREEALSPRWSPPFTESEEVLRHLRTAGHRVHLLSNNVDYLPILLRNLGWSELFETVTYSQEIGISKPDVRLFREALRRAGCEPRDAIHVGDSWEADYLGAKRAGLRAVWLNRGGVVPPEPCEMIRDLREIPQLME